MKSRRLLDIVLNNNVMIPVEGNWDEGFVFSEYSIQSTYLGEDAFGIKRFDTTYTEIGRLLHAMKYNGHFDTSVEIAERCIPYLQRWLSGTRIDSVLPTPPTNERTAQPVYMIAEQIAEKMGIPYTDTVLVKTDDTPAKSMAKVNKQLKGTIVQQRAAKRECNILLIDDFYSTGSTANECVSVLKSDPLIDKVYYFAIAKTK